MGHQNGSVIWLSNRRVKAWAAHAPASQLGGPSRGIASPGPNMLLWFFRREQPWRRRRTRSRAPDISLPAMPLHPADYAKRPNGGGCNWFQPAATIELPHYPRLRIYPLTASKPPDRLPFNRG